MSWKYTIDKIFIILLLCPFSKFSHPPSLKASHATVIRPTLIGLNPIGRKYYPFIISLDKYSTSCNATYDLPTKICILCKTKDMNVKIFHIMIV